jgi:VCBS repeat-containing protein
MRTKLRSKFTLFFIVCAALLAFAGTAMALTTDTSGNTAPAPTITSDKDDYAPGELVTLTGSGWQDGESVNIKVNDDAGQTWSRNVDVNADSSGNITDSFNLPGWFVATYSVTATGAQSGVATTSFTDGSIDVRAQAGTTNLAVTFPAGSVDRFNNLTCTLVGTSPNQTNASAFTTLTNGSYLASTVSANNTQSATIAAPSPITSGGTTYNFENWTSATSGVSIDSSTGCITRSGAANPAWQMTANYDAVPTVSSIVKADADPTNANSVSWTVNFSESVTGVNIGANSDFALASSSGISGASITNISGSGTTYTVTASTGSGNGTLGLNLVDDDTIVDAASNELGGTGLGNGNKTGEVYTVSKNVAPTDIGLTPSSVDENEPSGTTVGALSSDDPDSGDTHTYTLVGSGNDNASFTIDSSGNLKTAASFNYEADNSYTVRVRSTDAGGLFFEKNLTVTVNNVNETPVATGDTYSVNEDATLSANGTGTNPAGVLSNDSDPDGDTLSATLVSGTSNGTLTLNANGSFSYTPAANYNGSDSFTYRASDGQLNSNTVTVSITVNAVNDAPSFQLKANPDQTVFKDSGPQSVAGQVSSSSPGPTNESSQVVDFLVSNDNTNLFSVQPAISANGTLTYTPAAGAVGTATVTVKAHDDGTTANGGVDTSAPQTFKINVTYNWTGFFSPVDNPTTASFNWNSAKAGQSIPMKFRLAGNQGLSVLNGAPKVTQIACPSTSTALDAIEEYAVTANNGLTYDATADQYNFVWKTQSTYANKCFKFDMVLIDGTSHVAYFKFLK